MVDFRTWYNAVGHEYVPRNMMPAHKQWKEEARDIILEFDPAQGNYTNPKEVAWSDHGAKKATFKGFLARDVSTANGWTDLGARVWVYVDTGIKTADGKKSLVEDLEYEFYTKRNQKLPPLGKHVFSKSEKLHPLGELKNIENWLYKIYWAVNEDWKAGKSTQLPDNPQAIIVFQQEGRNIYPTRFVDFWGNATIHLNTPGFSNSTMETLY